MNAEPGLLVAGTELWRVGGRAGVPLSGRNWGDRLMMLNSAPLGCPSAGTDVMFLCSGT